MVGNSPCANDAATVTIDLDEAADAGLPNDVTVCNASTSFDLFDALDGTPDAGGTWVDLVLILCFSCTHPVLG